MFGQLGMTSLPGAHAQGTHTPSPAPGQATAGTGTGERAASGVRAETVERVDPVRRGAEPGAAPDLLPRDPRAPAGPPPAFKQSLLERTLAEAMQPPDQPAADPSAETRTEGDKTATDPVPGGPSAQTDMASRPPTGAEDPGPVDPGAAAAPTYRAPELPKATIDITR